MRSKIIGLAFLIALAGIIYLYEDNQRSFSTPIEAIQTESMEEVTVDKVFVSSIVNNHAIYFYINKQDNIVAVQLSKGLFGWRFGSSSTGSGLNIKHKISAPINGYIRNGDFVFGLATEQVDRIEVNRIQATVIPLDFYIEGKEIKDKKLWYVHIKSKSSESIQIQAYDKSNKEL